MVNDVGVGQQSVPSPRDVHVRMQARGGEGVVYGHSNKQPRLREYWNMGGGFRVALSVSADVSDILRWRDG